MKVLTKSLSNNVLGTLIPLSFNPLIGNDFGFPSSIALIYRGSSIIPIENFLESVLIL
jgi:hypothetical protein